MKNILWLLVAFHLCNTNISGQSSISFIVNNVPSTHNQNVGIRGSLAPLSWDHSILLEKKGDTYSVSLDFENNNNELEFKFVMLSGDNPPIWENIPNRTLAINGSIDIESSHIWNNEQIIDVSALKPIPSEKLLADYEIIKTVVLEVHPGAFRYNTKEEINSALEELKSSFSRSLTYQETYLAISKLTALLKCDHTKAGFNNQGKIINSIIHYQKDKVPFTFKWINDEMIVIHNASQSESLARGTKILSINTISVLDIRDDMLSYIGADGNTNDNRIYKTEVNGYDFRYNAFDIFYPLLYPLKSDQLKLEIQQINSERVEFIDVKALTREERFSNLTERYENFPKSRDDMWKFEVQNEKVAVLTLNSFGLNGWKAMTIDYKYFLAQAFKTLDSNTIENLIIDIRENTGGNDEMAEELFRYLSKTDYNFKREMRTRYVEFPSSLKPFIKTWGDTPWYYTLNPKVNKAVNGYYSFNETIEDGPNISDKNIYKGKTYLITSSANTSLAFYTAAKFKFQKIGTTIGTETGGNLNDINGGQMLFLNLPNSGIEIDFPIMGAFTITPQNDQGVIPDIVVNYSRQDIVNNKDLEVMRLLEMINN